MKTLSQRMIDQMEAHGFSQDKILVWVRHVAAFAAYYGCSPDVLTLDSVQDYQVYLLSNEKLTWDRVADIVDAIEFFYCTTLRRRGRVQRMTPLRLRLIVDMHLRHFSSHTMWDRVRRVAAFARYCGSSPERLGPKAVRDFLIHLTLERKVSIGVFNAHIAALRQSSPQG